MCARSDITSSGVNESHATYSILSSKVACFSVKVGDYNFFLLLTNESKKNSSAFVVEERGKREGRMEGCGKRS